MSTVVGHLRFQVIHGTSPCAARPSITIDAPSGWKILGGGASVNWEGPCAPPSPQGNLLTGVFPNEDGTTWTASSKDHLESSPASITAYAIVAQMEDGSPIPNSDYTIVSNTSEKAQHPELTVYVPEEFSVVGGGARANYIGLGSMLYSTHPVESRDGWIGAAKDHMKPDPSTITVWAIGLRRSFLHKVKLFVRIFEDNSALPFPHPGDVVVEVPGKDFHITGGGARIHWENYDIRIGSLLTATYPGADNRTWIADGKDHLEPCPSIITVWVIALKRKVE